MRKQLREDAAMAGTILLLGVALVYVGTVLLQRWLVQGRPGRTPGFEDALGAVSAAIGSAVVLWWLFALLLALVSCVLHRTGRRRLAGAAGRLTPAFMRRLVLAVLGVNLLCAPLAHGAESPVDPLWHPAVATTAPAAPVLPAARTAVDPVTPGAPEPPSPLWKPEAPVVFPGPLAPVPSRPPDQMPSSRGEQTPASPGGHAAAQPVAPAANDAGSEDANMVVVRAGDSLWTLAAKQLGPFATDVEIARQWPLWYRINRAVIGSDPGLILPGQILQEP
ncbi:LysM peptidoglycan-binding domain-containing protein [Arthrobacter sp. A5]|uniref:LysM peptidoglycan-binding domain-containing protein n=1 Tax=Arthrobacter sp. A5 TaxID=576926 RepID=UPI003DA84056